MFYHLFLNPLSRFPGPRHLAASRLFLTRRLLNGTQAHWIARLHEEYGPIVRVAPDQLSFTDERAWNDVCGSTPAAKYGMEKDERLNELVGGETLNPDPNISKADQKHTQMRRAFAPGLTKAALRQQEYLIQGHVNELIDEVKTRGLCGQKPINVVDMYNFLAYNIFSNLFLGESLDLLKDDKYVPWVHSMLGFARATIAMGALQHYFVMRYILAFIIKRFGKKPRDAFMNVCFERFDRRVQRKTDHPDLFYFATKEKKASQLPLKDMREFSPFLMIAGGETTPTLLSGLTNFLLTHPEKMARLTKEVRGAFQSDEDITMANLFKLEYLNACIEEALRVYPPIAAGVERVVPRGGAPVAGHHIPGGTVVLVPDLAMFHYSKNFARPKEFIPERWLPDAGEEFAKDRHQCHKPFSVGPHACFGQE